MARAEPDEPPRAEVSGGARKSPVDHEEAGRGRPVYTSGTGSAVQKHPNAERINDRRRQDLLGCNHRERYPTTVVTPIGNGYRRVTAERAPLRIENYDELGRSLKLNAFPTRDGGPRLYGPEAGGGRAAAAATGGPHRLGRERRRRTSPGRPDGTILWSYEAECDLPGDSREEYVVHGVTEFHADRPVIGDILGRLTKGEELNSYEARLRCRGGTVRHVHVCSNAYRETEAFRHTRRRREEAGDADRG